MENYFSCFLVFSMLDLRGEIVGDFLLLCSSNGDGMSGRTEVGLGSWFFAWGWIGFSIFSECADYRKIFEFLAGNFLFLFF
jgi:hypothetical protein